MRAQGREERRHLSEKKRLLSLFGVLLSVMGFYVGKASSFPFLQGLLAPSYSSAKRAIEHIQKERSLQAGQPDFAALADIVESRIASQNPHVSRSAIVLEKLEATGGGMAFGAAASRQIVGLKMTLHGQSQPLQWDLLELADVIEHSWATRSLRWAQWLFWIGVLQTLWPLWLERKPRKRVEPPLPPPAEAAVSASTAGKGGAA